MESILFDRNFIRGKEIGWGNNGVVYKVTDEASGKHYAMKVIKQNKNLPPKTQNLLQEEIECMQKFNHKNIMKQEKVVYSDMEIEQIFDYCNDGTIVDYLHKNNKFHFAEEEAWTHLRGIVSGYKKLYKHKRLHRNIEPKNQFQNDGNIVMGDFGLKAFELSNFYVTSGSSIYQAPEVLLDKKFVKKSDLWSVGCSFFYMLFGRPPFKYGSTSELIKEQKDTSGKNLYLKMDQGVSEEVFDLLAKMLAYNTEERITWEQLFNHPLLKDDLFASFTKLNAQNVWSCTDGEYSGDVSVGLRCGNGTFKSRTGEIYEGEWFGNLPQGQGVLWCTNGIMYDGTWKKGKPNGYGQLVYPNGKKFVGEFKAGRIIGRCLLAKILMKCEEDKIDQIFNVNKEGDFVGDEKFIGRYRNGFKCGNGFATYSDGRKYDGNWKEGKKDGHGEMSFPNGDKYIGLWKNGNKDGAGLMMYNKGGKYAGGWQNDHKEGFGEYTYANGDQCHGEFAGGVIEGKGVLYGMDGTKYDGVWLNDKKHGYGEYVYANGDVYSGDWKEGKTNGRGVIEYQRGAKYDGEWKDDMKHGYGDYTLVNGDKYEGYWKNDLKHGISYISKPNGEVGKAEFDNGNFKHFI